MLQAISWTIGLWQGVNGRLKRHKDGFSGERFGSEGIGSCHGDGECQEVEDQKRNANHSGRLVPPHFEQHHVSVAEFSYPQCSRLGLDTDISPRHPRPSCGQESLNCLSPRISLHYRHLHSFISPPRPEIVADPSAYREFKRKRRLLDERGSNTTSITTSSPALVSSKCE